MKKAILIVLTILMVLPLSACGEKKQNAANKKGDKIKYSIDEIYDQGNYGFYVKNKDDTFTPLMSAASGRDGTPAGSTDLAGRFVWWSNIDDGNATIDYNKLTPKVTKKTPLVAIYPTRDDMPDEYTIERYEFLGYTLGAKIFLGEDENSMYFSPKDPCPNSSFAQMLDGKKLGETVEIAKINGSKDLPYDNVDQNVQALLGLEKNKYYKLLTYVGTSAKTVVIKADTQIYKSVEVIELVQPLKPTEYQYFIVNLPDNMDSGYYYMNDAGMFKC